MLLQLQHFNVMLLASCVRLALFSFRLGKQARGWTKSPVAELAGTFENTCIDPLLATPVHAYTARTHACMQPATVLHPISHANLWHHTPPASAIPRLPILRLRRRILLLLLRRIGLLRRLLLIRGLCWRIHRLPGRLLPVSRLRLVVWRGLVAVLHGRLVDRRSRCRRSRRRREQRETRRRPTRPLARRVLAQLSAHMLQRNELCLWRAHNPAQTTRGSSQVLA